MRIHHSQPALLIALSVFSLALGPSTRAHAQQPRPGAVQTFLNELVIETDPNRPTLIRMIKFGRDASHLLDKEAVVKAIRANAAKAREAGKPLTWFRITAPPYVEYKDIDALVGAVQEGMTEPITFTAKVDPQWVEYLIKRDKRIVLAPAEVTWKVARAEEGKPIKLDEAIQVEVGNKGLWGLVLAVPKSKTVPTTMAELKAVLEKLKASGAGHSAETLVVIKPSRGTLWTNVIQAMLVAQEAGYKQVVVSDLNGELPEHVRTTEPPTKTSPSTQTVIKSPKTEVGPKPAPKSPFAQGRPVGFMGLLTRQPERIVFVIDGPLDHEGLRKGVSNSLTDALKSISEKQQFAVLFSAKGKPAALGQGWLEGGEATQQRVAAWVESKFEEATRESGGGTRLLEALKEALAMKPSSIMVVTRQPLGEGELAASAEDMAEQVRRANTEGVPIFACQLVEKEKVAPGAVPVMERIVRESKGLYRLAKGYEFGIK